ncbi:MAG: hypothetical protein U0271_45015 [Polyangiaceae bacterium]
MTGDTSADGDTSTVQVASAATARAARVAWGAIVPFPLVFTVLSLVRLWPSWLGVTLGLVSLFVSALALTWSFLAARPAAATTAKVTVGPAELVLESADASRTLRPADVRGGFVIGKTLELALRSGETLTLLFGSSVQAARALTTLKIDAAHQRLTIETTSPQRPVHAAALAIASVVATSFVTERYSFVIGLIVGALVAYEFSPRRLTIGRDGVELRWPFHRRFARYERISALDGRGHELRLRLMGGNSYRLPTHAPADAIARRVLEATAALGGSRVRALERGKRTISAWLEQLDSIKFAEPGYRDAGLDRGTLLEVLEDPAAPTDQRVAAAIALRLAGVDEAREPIRLVSSTFADPKARATIARLAEAELEQAELEAALAVVEPRAARR